MIEPVTAPDFLIVGAPKCGTTALYRYLGQHPEIFVSRIKEPHFFGSDLSSEKFIRDEQAYLALLSPSHGEHIVGEASVYYLHSRTAAAEIKSHNPSAKIIIMLRNPVDMIYSLHSQAVSSGSEDILDFADALDAEQERRLGRRIPEIADFPQGLLYRDVARYAQQVERFLDLFGHQQVHIIIFDDFAATPHTVFRETLAFLGARDTDFQVRFDKVNESRRLRSVALEHFLKKQRALRGALKRATPRVYSTLYSTLHRLNTTKSERRAMDPNLRAALCEEYAAEVRALSRIVGRDLSAWTRPDGVRVG